MAPLAPWALVVLLAPVVASCAADTSPEEAPGLRMRVEWLTASPSADLPADLHQIRVIRTIEGESVDVTQSVANFETDPDGTPYLSLPILSNLPTGVPIDIDVEGNRMGGQFAYVGHVGPIVLAPGQRHYADLKMYEMGVSAPTVAEDTPAVFLQGATALPDGRVLVAGGFDRVTGGATCPAFFPADTVCFTLAATNKAWVFSVTTSRFYEVQGGMLAARGGHTVTALGNGRVIIAGGAAKAIFGLIPIGDPAAPSGYTPILQPLNADDTPGAHASFEVFLHDANREEHDADGDGDPGRGGFTGSAANGGVVGRLNQERFLHSAAATLGTNGNRILIVGGRDGVSGHATYEVYDDQKAGGYGTYDNAGAMLTTVRTSPGVVELASGQVWIFGGTPAAASNDELAEIWTPDPTAANGSVENATTTSYPGAGDHPEFALLGPSVAAIGTSGDHALVVGWMGPSCMPGGSVPDFAGTELCPSMGGGPPRSHSVDGATGDVLGAATNSPHALAGAATLDDGSVVISGGIANLLWTAQPSIELFTGRISSGNAELSPSRFVMRSPRAMHTTSALKQLGMLSVGGISVASASTGSPSLSILDGAEVLYLPRSARPPGG